MPTDISAAIVRTAREKAQAEIDVLDIRVIVAASVWLAFYLIMLIGAIVDQPLTSTIELAAHY